MTNSGPRNCWDRDDRLSQVHGVIRPPLLSVAAGYRCTPAEGQGYFELCSHTRQSKRKVWIVSTVSWTWVSCHLSWVLEQHQIFLSLRCLKNMDYMSTAALLVVLFQYLIIIYNLPALDGSQSKQLVCREKVPESRDATHRQDCQWAHCSHLLCALEWETASDTQTYCNLGQLYLSSFGCLSLKQMFSSHCNLPWDLVLCVVLYFGIITGRLFQVEEGQEAFSLLDFDIIITGVGDLLFSASSQTFLMIASDFSPTCPFP